MRIAMHCKPPLHCCSHFAIVLLQTAPQQSGENATYIWFLIETTHNIQLFQCRSSSFIVLNNVSQLDKGAISHLRPMLLHSAVVPAIQKARREASPVKY